MAYVHDHFGVHRTHLRVGLSPLREHRFGRHFIDTNDPMCLANDGIDNVTHSMLICQENAVPLCKVTPICSTHGADCNKLNNEE